MKPFTKLRAKVFEKGYSEADIAKLHNRGLTYVSQRFMARAEWTQGDQYFLMDLLNIPYVEMHEYFPPKGYPKND